MPPSTKLYLISVTSLCIYVTCFAVSLFCLILTYLYTFFFFSKCSHLLLHSLQIYFSKTILGNFLTSAVSAYYFTVIRFLKNQEFLFLEILSISGLLSFWGIVYYYFNSFFHILHSQNSISEVSTLIFNSHFIPKPYLFNK